MKKNRTLLTVVIAILAILMIGSMIKTSSADTLTTDATTLCDGNCPGCPTPCPSMAPSCDGNCPGCPTPCPSMAPSCDGNCPDCPTPCPSKMPG